MGGSGSPGQVCRASHSWLLPVSHSCETSHTLSCCQSQCSATSLTQNQQSQESQAEVSETMSLNKPSPPEAALSPACFVPVRRKGTLPLFLFLCCLSLPYPAPPHTVSLLWLTETSLPTSLPSPSNLVICKSAEE